MSRHYMIYALTLESEAVFSELGKDNQEKIAMGTRPDIYEKFSPKWKKVCSLRQCFPLIPGRIQNAVFPEMYKGHVKRKFFNDFSVK